MVCLYCLLLILNEMRDEEGHPGVRLGLSKCILLSVWFAIHLLFSFDDIRAPGTLFGRGWKGWKGRLERTFGNIEAL